MGPRAGLLACGFRCKAGFRKSGNVCKPGREPRQPPPPPPPPPPAQQQELNLTTGLQPPKARGTGSSLSRWLSSFSQLAARSRRIQDIGSRASQPSGPSRNSALAASVLVNATCGPGFNEESPCPEYADALLLSLTPREYSSSNLPDTGGFNFISPSQDQMRCAACVGFAATAAAEAAIAAGLRQHWHEGPSLSEANISFCGGVIPPVSCNSGSSFDSLVFGARAGRLLWWTARSSFPYTGSTYSTDCSIRENAVPPGGQLQMVDSGSALDSIARIKEAILLYGGVITSMTMWSDFKRYPRPARGAPAGSALALNIYNRTKAPAGDGLPDLHAVFCYGWNDTSDWSSQQSAFAGGSGLRGYLLCKNSWGSTWGLNGTFKIAYGAAEVLQGDYTFAMRFQRNNRSQDALKLLMGNAVAVTDPNYPTCWLFTPPYPMRLLHVADELSHAWEAGLESGATNVPSEREILQDLVSTNSRYNGQGTADRIEAGTETSNASPRDAASNSSLTALRAWTTAGAGQALGGSSFLICNRTAEILLQCPPGTQANYKDNSCAVCPTGQFKTQSMHACKECPAGTSTLPTNLPADHNELEDCSPLVTEGPADVFLEVSRSPVESLGSQAALLGNDPNWKWFELLCPPGHFVAQVSAHSLGGFITQLSATCSDGTELVPEVGAAGVPASTPASANGFTGLAVGRSSAGVQRLQLMLANASKTELLGAPAGSGVHTELLLLCNTSDLAAARLIGFYGGFTVLSSVSADPVLAAVGVICGSQAGPFYTGSFESASAGAPGKIAPSASFNAVCRKGAFITGIAARPNQLDSDNLQLYCSDGLMFANVFADPKAAQGLNIGTTGNDSVAVRSAKGFTTLQVHAAPVAQLLQIRNVSVPPTISHLNSFIAGLGAAGDDEESQSFFITDNTFEGAPKVSLKCGGEGSSTSGARILGMYGKAITASFGSDQRHLFLQLGLICSEQALIVARCPGLPQLYKATASPTTEAQPDDAATWNPFCRNAPVGSQCAGTCDDGPVTSTCTPYGWGSPIGGCTGGPVQLRPRLQHNLCLTTANNINQGALLMLQPCSNHTSHQWITQQSDGTIRLAQDPTKCLDAGTAGRILRTQPLLRIYNCVTNRQSQKWLFDRAMNRLKPLSASWLCLEAGAPADGQPASTGNAANMPILSSCSGTKAQYGGSPYHQWLWVASK
eukprot:gene2179-2496_t